LDFGLKEAIRLTGSKIGYIYYYMRKLKILLCILVFIGDGQCASWRSNIYQLGKNRFMGRSRKQRKAVITNDYSAPNCYKKAIRKGMFICSAI